METISIPNSLDFNNTSILISGGAGFIGANLAMTLQENFPQAKIIIFDNFDNGHFKNLIGFKGELIAGDITDPVAIKRLERHHFNYIFHQAAITDTTVMDQKRMVEVNTNAFRDILYMAEEMGSTVVYASSAAVYGNSPAPNRIGVGEIPENVYGYSKYLMDQIAYEYMENHSNPLVGLRYFNVYGPGESYKGKMASMIYQLALKMMRGETPRLFKYGEQKRDFVYVKDIVQANLKAAMSGKSGVYNVGFGKARTFNDMVNIINEELNLKLEIEYFDNPYTFYQNNTRADISDTQKELGYEAEFSLEAGIKDYLSYLKK